MELNQQNVIVTGANRGLGRTIAAHFAKCGATVGMLGRSPDKLESARDEIIEETEAKPESVQVLEADVTDGEQVDDVIGDWNDELDEGIHTLVNNAGINRDGTLLRMSDDDWKDVIDVNLNGAFYCTKSVIRPMMRNRWGRLIMISSISGLMGNEGQTNYSASKAGLVGFCRAVARELGSRDITANTIAPGFIKTGMTERMDDGQKDIMEGVVPMERFGEPEEVAECATFLASERASYITGEVINVDGGMGMTGYM